LDLDPNNIENKCFERMLQLFYGTAGKQVILITTKAGSKQTGPRKTEISVNQSIFINEIASLQITKQLW
jgi:hypothetical protein